MRWFSLWCILPGVCLAAAVFTFLLEHLKPYTITVNFVDPAPAWLLPALESLPSRMLDDEEVTIFQRDGVFPVRGVLQHPHIIGLLREISKRGKEAPEQQWMNNGVIRKLVFDHHLAAVVASALNVSAVRIWEIQFENKSLPAGSNPTPPIPPHWRDGGPSGFDGANVHNDFHFTPPHTLIPLASIFIALDSTSFPLEFLAGSHLANLKHRCPGGLTPWSMDEHCMDRLYASCDGVRRWDLKAGDGIIFYGQTFHWTILRAEPRVGVSFRFMDADLPWVEELALWGDVRWIYGSYFPRLCAPLGDNAVFPIVFPNNMSTWKDKAVPILNMDLIPALIKYRYSWSEKRQIETFLTGRYQDCNYQPKYPIDL
eukprot:gnl/TRDRNA2_/TRDRNA2_30263_c0_seq1.p1 gnl/TRDRNA2_/TRDRNA2_30263_c0~~gnl/TRDRNA2_/TRDRNA2_30263_c0_seq1.p1  ORF type:complete len:370 (-),score=19.00 gnl/TRDRNA2_/TRDRNA2_30263_c0_seq1:155-1264(-)